MIRMRTTISKLWPLCFCVLGMILMSNCSGIRTIGTDQLKLVDLGNLENLEAEQDLSVLEKFSQGEPVGEPIIFKVPKGFSLPVHMKIDIPFAEMDSKCSYIVFTRDLFLYIDGDHMLVSPDRNSWAALGDMKSVQELYGGGQGEVAIGMSVNKERGPLLEVNVLVKPEE